MRTPFRILNLLLLAGVLVAPASRVWAQEESGDSQASETGLGIRLTEAPVAMRDDPRARVYIIDHVNPGDSFSRAIEIINDTDDPMQPSAYVAPAVIDDGQFIVGSRENDGPVKQWATLEPGSLDLAPRSTATVTLTVSVPADAEEGEYYGGAVAEVIPTADSPGVTLASRVAIRIYLSVGEGSAPVSDFEISTLTAERHEDGTPVVSASVTNTGGRALDMSGELELENGPGGVSAGPFPATLGTTLGIGETEPVTVVLDKELPNGPWDATLTLRSGTIERTVTATIEFPDPGEDPKEFDAEEVKGKSWWALLALALLLLVLAALAYYLYRRRKRQGSGAPIAS